MNTTTQAEREKALGFEIFRLMGLAREHGPEELLDLALAGREKNVASVTKLFQFVLRSFGEPTGLVPSAVTRKFWQACSAFLKEEAGLTPEQLETIRHPFPTTGEPGFQSILDEIREEGLLP